MNQGSLKYISCFFIYYSIESNVVLGAAFIPEPGMKAVGN